MNSRQLKTVRKIEERLKSAGPDECAQLTRMLVKLKDDMMHK